ncbi:MAG: PTS transporter subunit EIIC [Finegoldia sp.]|nr:PTS transporter subunit EIIC [Finegoldia sp.]
MTKEKSVFKKVLDDFVELLSSLFMPFINLMISTGIIKGILSLMLATNLIDQTSSTYEILNAIGDAFFYFIPVFLAITAAKRFGVETFTAALIGCILLHPSMTSLMSSEGSVTFFSIEVPKVIYSSSVIPIILAIYFTKYVQGFCYRIIPETFRGLFTPPICLLIVIPATLFIFGPIGKVAGGWLASGYEIIYNLSPLLAGVVVGSLQPFMVMFGLHWGLFTVAINNIALVGYDTILALFGPAIFAQGGAALAVALKTKDKKFKSQAISASLTTLLGITEPAMYGVNLKLKRPMVCACISGGVGGAVAGLFGCRATSFALPALTTLPVFMSNAFIQFLLSLVIAFVLAFVLVMVSNKNSFKEIIEDKEETK